MTAILGFIAQCNVCPQRAVVDVQPAGDWTCPRCAEVTGGFGDIDVAQAEPVRAFGPHDIVATVDDTVFPGWTRVLCNCGAHFCGNDLETAYFLQREHQRRVESGDDHYPIEKVRG